MNPYGIEATCLDCGHPLQPHRPGTHHPARVTTVLACTDCGAELVLRVELVRITPARSIDQRARDYRNRKRLAS